jgi:hypothetical protein
VIVVLADQMNAGWMGCAILFGDPTRAAIVTEAQRRLLDRITTTTTRINYL